MYGDWDSRIVRRVQRRFEEIDAHYNFDLGDEFEIAVAEILRSLLPSRAGVCRGFIVAQDGTLAGDDIIVFDRARFPTLRLLGDSLALKEQVPLEGVLAYLEAKHTLYFRDDDTKKASLLKACKQIRAVHALPSREAVTPLQLKPYLSLPPAQFGWQPNPGYFEHRNSLYTAILARHAAMSEDDKRPPTLEDLPGVGAAVDRAAALSPSKAAFPAVIAAGEVFIVPTIERDGVQELRPVEGPDGVRPHASLIEGGSLGLAVMHLLWAIEQIELGVIPWDKVLAQAAKKLKRRP